MIGPGPGARPRPRPLPDRVQAYTVNILGSVAGIVAVRRLLCWSCPRSGGSRPCSPASCYFLLPEHRLAACRALPRPGARAGLAVEPAASVLAGRHRAQDSGRPTTASITSPASKLINVNLIGHQQMLPRGSRRSRPTRCRTCSTATPAASRSRRADHRRRLRQRRQPRPAVGRRARRRRRDRPGHPPARQAATTPTAPTTTRASPSTSTTAGTSSARPTSSTT